MVATGEMTAVAVSPVNRKVFRFVEAVVSEFRFLEDLGFVRACALDTFVRYEREPLFVNVFHGRGSYELGVEVGHRVLVDGELVDEKFTLGELVAMADPSRVFPGFAAVTPEQVQRFVPQLASLAEQFGANLLRGDPAEFARLRLDTAARSEAMREGWRASQLRSRADSAWRERDFGRVVDAYGEMLSELRSVSLTASEVARLRYAAVRQELYHGQLQSAVPRYSVGRRADRSYSDRLSRVFTHWPVRDEQRTGSGVYKCARESAIGGTVHSRTTRAVARRQNYPVGVEPQSRDF